MKAQLRRRRASSKLLISSAPARRETKLAIMEHFRNSQPVRALRLDRGRLGDAAAPRRADRRKLGSVGREWTGSGAIKLLDADGNEVPDGEVGELFSRTPYVFDGYWKNPEKTAEAFRGAWCSVGDMARRDERRLLPPGRPQEQHDHQRRREHLSVGGRERARRASGGARTSR